MWTARHSLSLALTVTFSILALKSPRLCDAHERSSSLSNQLGNLTKNKSQNPLLVSPTPSEYVGLYKFACAVNNKSQQVSKNELSERYSTSYWNERLQQYVQDWNIHRQCRREMTAWRYSYIDELDSVTVRERSIDERSANVMYLTRAMSSFSLDIFTYNWEDSRKDEENKRRVAGPKVDDDLCGVQLRQMLTILDQLKGRVSLMRSLQSSLNSSSSSTLADKNEATILTDQHISLAKILDSYGRYDSGRLWGKIFAQGSYHQCTWNKLVVDHDNKIGMRFCWAHLGYNDTLAESLRRREKGTYEHPNNVLFSGICIPESCHSRSFPRYKHELQALINTQFIQPQTMFVDTHMRMESLYCLVDEDSEFRVPLAGKLLMAFLAGWCVVTFSVTCWNAKKRRLAKLDANAMSNKKKRTMTILDSLDLVQSWKELISEKNDPGKIRAVQLDAINFIKVFGCAFVVLGHTLVLFAVRSADAVRVARIVDTDPIIRAIIAGTMVVDTFFVITGILWAYFTLKRLNKNPPREPRDRGSCVHVESHLEMTQLKLELADEDSGQSTDNNTNHNESPVTIREVEPWLAPINEFCCKWLHYTLFRWLRIVPLYAIIHWFKKFVFIYSGRGPFWDHGLNYSTLNGACHKESFLTPFTFLAAYYPLSRQCTFQSWSIANDIFFAILAPPVILLINRRPRMAVYLSIVSCLISYAWAQYQISQVPTHLDEELRELRSFGFYRFFDSMSIFYTAPHLRIFCFIIGVWGGYFLYHKQLKIDCLRRARGGASSKGRQQQTLAKPKEQNGARGALVGICVEMSRKGEKEQLVSDRIEWPSWMRGWGTVASLLYIVGVIVGFAFIAPVVKPYLDPYYREIYPQFVTSARIMWALANVVLFIRMMTDWKDNIWMRWSASKFWLICTKLNYAILLIHMDLLIYTLDTSTSMPNNFTKWSFFNLGAGVLMFSFPLSVFVYVVFENPIDKLIRSRLSGY